MLTICRFLKSLLNFLKRLLKHKRRSKGHNLVSDGNICLFSAINKSLWLIAMHFPAISVLSKQNDVIIWARTALSKCNYLYKKIYTDKVGFLGIISQMAFEEIATYNCETYDKNIAKHGKTSCPTKAEYLSSCHQLVLSKKDSLTGQVYSAMSNMRIATVCR